MNAAASRHDERDVGPLAEPTPIVERTPRLLLREFREDDRDAVLAMISNPSVVAMLPWGPFDEAEAAAFLRRARGQQRQRPRRNFELAIALPEGGAPIGGCGLNVFGATSHEAQIHYWLDPRYWGRGFATEAAAALVRLGFRDLGLHRVFATCDVLNAASRRVLTKIGMQQEGVLREHLCIATRWRSSCLFSILVDEWRTGRS